MTKLIHYKAAEADPVLCQGARRAEFSCDYEAVTCKRCAARLLVKADDDAFELRRKRSILWCKTKGYRWMPDTGDVTHREDGRL